MTRVRLTQEPGKRYTLTCEGHATGSPEVCAAISCLAGSLEGWVENSPSADAQQLDAADEPDGAHQARPADGGMTRNLGDERVEQHDDADDEHDHARREHQSDRLD